MCMMGDAYLYNFSGPPLTGSLLHTDISVLGPCWSAESHTDDYIPVNCTVRH